MMEKFKAYSYFILALLLLGCQPSASNTENNRLTEQSYILHFGQQGFKDFAEYNQGQVDNHPSGAGFRDLKFSPPHLGQIKVENGASSLVINHVFSVLGTSFHQADGIEGLDINAGLNKEEFVSPEQAYHAYVELMKQINQAGWKLYIARYNSRIAKEDNIRYLMEWGYILDPSYIFTYAEWQKIISTSVGNSFVYRLYANGLLVSISIKRTKKTEDGKEQYMLRYAFDTIRYAYRDLMNDAEPHIDTYKMTAQELEQAFKDLSRQYKKLREKQEKEVIAQGYHIDENYVGPDIWHYVK